MAGRIVDWQDRELTAAEEVYWLDPARRYVRKPAVDNDEGCKQYKGLPDIKHGQVMRDAMLQCMQLRGYWCSRDFTHAQKVINREANEDRLQALKQARRLQRQEEAVAGRRSVLVSDKDIRKMIPKDEVGKALAAASQAVVKENLTKAMSLAEQPGLSVRDIKKILLNNFREFCLKCKIEGKDGKMVQFVWNRPQRQLAKMLATRLVTEIGRAHV